MLLNLSVEGLEEQKEEASQTPEHIFIHRPVWTKSRLLLCSINICYMSSALGQRMHQTELMSSKNTPRPNML